MKRKKDKGQHSSGRVHPGVDLSVDHSLTKVVSVVIGFAVLRVITAILFDRDPALWGWSYVSFVLTKPDVLIALGLPLLLLFPKVLGTTIRFVDSGASATTRHQRPWRLLFSILIAGFALIYSFPVLAAFLGDGAIILSEVYRLYDPSLQSDFFFKPTSFLTGVLIESIVAMYDTDDLRKIFTILGLIAFVLLVILTRWLLRDERRSVALILGSGMLLSAGSLFFFRYIELYQMQYVFVAGYYLAAWRYLSGRGSLWMPVALLSLAVFFGAAALVHAPTLLIFLYGRGGSAGAVQRKIAIATAAAVPLLALVVSIALSGRVDSPLVHYLIPFSALPVDAGGVAAMNRYTLLSAAHLRDSVNALWLHAGPALTLLILLPVIGGKRD
ncbi:MAG: hypothetical protein JXA28_10425, partial [Bacteroidetes bacterium]|nr:hypothetical protein [Bacteroidota bacterium]